MSLSFPQHGADLIMAKQPAKVRIGNREINIEADKFDLQEDVDGRIGVYLEGQGSILMTTNPVFKKWGAEVKEKDVKEGLRYSYKRAEYLAANKGMKVLVKTVFGEAVCTVCNDYRDSRLVTVVGEKVPQPTLKQIKELAPSPMSAAMFFHRDGSGVYGVNCDKLPASTSPTLGTFIGWFTYD